eukprot:6478059-Amphidinium_carterae.1
MPPHQASWQPHAYQVGRKELGARGSQLEHSQRSTGKRMRYMKRMRRWRVRLATSRLSNVFS